MKCLAIINRLMIDHIHIPEAKIVFLDINDIRFDVKWHFVLHLIERIIL